MVVMESWTLLRGACTVVTVALGSCFLQKEGLGSVKPSDSLFYYYWIFFKTFFIIKNKTKK
jgi:hypothetical protein